MKKLSISIILTSLLLTACGGMTHESLGKSLQEKGIVLRDGAEKISSPLFEPLGYALRTKEGALQIETFALNGSRKAKSALEQFNADGTPKDESRWKPDGPVHVFQKGGFIAVVQNNDATLLYALEEILGKQVVGASMPEKQMMEASSEAMMVSSAASSR